MQCKIFVLFAPCFVIHTMIYYVVYIPVHEITFLLLSMRLCLFRMAMFVGPFCGTGSGISGVKSSCSGMLDSVR